VALAYPEVDLTDGAVLLRRWRDDDLDCVRAAAQDPRISESTTVPAPFSVGAGRAFLRRQWSRADNGEGLSLAIAWLIPSARGRGLATRAAGLVAEWALDVAGIVRVEAWVEPDNLASQRVLTAAAFEREGVLRSFLVFPGRRADAVVFSAVRETCLPR
jgi:GNAT superfamily N-acetyltransferase